MKESGNIPGLKSTVGHNSAKSVKESSGRSKFKPKVDFLAVSDEIKHRYGVSRGKVLAWKTLKSFQQGAMNDGWVPVKRIDEDALEIPSFGIGSDANAALNNFFTKNELILAEIDESEYNDKQEYEADLSRSRRSKESTDLSQASANMGGGSSFQKIEHEQGLLSKDSLASIKQK